MSFGSFLRGIATQVNPFDNGRTYGTVNPPQKKKPEQHQQFSPYPGVKTNAPSNIIPGNTTLFDFGKLNTTNQVSVPTQYQAPAPKPSHGWGLGRVFHDVTHNPVTNAVGTGAKDVGGAVAGAALGAARAGEGIVQGTLELPSLAAHGGDWIASKITGNPTTDLNGQSTNPVTRFLDQKTATVLKPIDWLSKQTDQASQAFGPVAAKVYKPAQYVTNAATIVPGVAELGANLLTRAGKVDTTATKVLSKVGSQSKRPNINLRSFTNPSVDEPLAEAALASDATQIPVQSGNSNTVNVPVRNQTQPGRLIQDVSGGETYQTPNALIQHNAEEAARASADRFNSTHQGNIHDITPRSNEPFKLSDADIKANQQKIIDDYAATLKSLGEGNGVDITPDGRRLSNNVRSAANKGKRMTKADWQAEAEAQLNAGKAEPGTQQAFNDAANPDAQSQLNQEPPSNEPGKPINVKQITPIDVQQVENVPANLPETPGKVRVTTAKAPVQAQSEAIAAQTPPPIPTVTPDVQAILDNPKKFSKTQVDAARNQLKLAKKLAKTKADTQAVIDNSPQLAPKSQGNPGFVPTGEFRRGVNGNVSEIARADAEAAQAATDTANLSAGDVLSKAEQETVTNGRVSPESVRNMQAMLESGRFAQTSPEYRALAQKLYGAGSDYGRGLSLFNPTLRRTASGDQLTNRFVSKLYGVTEDGSKLTDAHIAQVQQAENNFTTARDAANQALDRYNATKTPEDFAAWKQVQTAAENAQKQSLITEYRVANDVLKGNKNPEALKAIQKAEKEAGVYQMDWIDANMLSGTGTATRNYVNTALVRMENRIFGQPIRGGAGAKIGNALGNKSVVADFKARNELDQNKLSKAIKQWSTTANTLGEGNIRAVGSARAYKYYAEQLKKQGITGDQLKRDTEVMLHTDPDGAAQRYEQWALSENALSGLAHSKKFEQQLVEAIASKGGDKLAQTSAKAAVRLTVGFPTVIARSLIGGVKRATFGVPDLISAGKAFAKGDSQAMKDALYAAKVHAGSGAALYALGTGLAEAGIISPAYPSDPAEQARWKAEGIQPNSIKIGGQWFSIPGYFGALALPLTIPANVMNKTSPADVAKGIIDGIQELSPTTGIQNFIDGMEGRGGKQWVKNEVTSLTRAFTPVGSLLNEISKMADSTKNDTTTKDGINNLLDNIASGIPGLNNAVNKIPATDANGNVLHNPNPVATFFGAQGSSQPQGQQDVQQAQDQANSTYADLQQNGVLDNANLMGLVDPKIQAQIKRGQDLTPEQVTAVQKAVTKGIGTGISASSDSNWRENGDYATDRAATQVKLQLLQADPTAKKSDIANLNTQIARDNVLEQNQVSYDDLKLYEDTTQTEWAHMGDSTNDAYDPATYQKLAQLDGLLTEAKGSYASDPTKNKYDPKGAGSGSGSKKKMETSFGTLSSGSNPFAPKVRQYQTASINGNGGIPVIQRVEPNIVHRIGTG